MTSNFILVYIAVILGVATYFYLRKKLREGRDRREERIRNTPTVYYVTRNCEFGGKSELYSAHMTLEEAEIQRTIENRNNESGIHYFGVMYRDEKMCIKKEDA